MCDSQGDRLDEILLSVLVEVNGVALRTLQRLLRQIAPRSPSLQVLLHVGVVAPDIIA